MSKAIPECKMEANCVTHSRAQNLKSLFARGKNCHGIKIKMLNITSNSKLGNNQHNTTEVMLFHKMR